MRSEEMVEMALPLWLPIAVTGRPPSGRAANDALVALASIQAEEHQDFWLRDFLNSIRDHSLDEGPVDLAHAVAANIAGNPVQALRFARRAEAFMRARGNQPGVLRAELEEMYSFQRRSDARDCLAGGRLLERALKTHTYPWLAAQLALEEAICLNMRGEFVLGHQALQRAIDSSKGSRYGILHLRAIGIRASFYTDIGNLGTAWSDDREGLSKYWDGTYPEQRAYQFYADMAIIAQKQNQWNLAAILEHEAAQIISRTPNRSVEAMAWNRYGSLAHTAGLTLEAESAYQTAEHLFNQLPEDPATRIYRLDCELNLAALEAEGGDPSAPLQRLLAIKKQVLKIPNITIQKRFYQTLGTLQVRRGDYSEGIKAFQAALTLGDAGFRALKNERERLAWKQETAKIYRGLVDVQFRWKHDTDSALRLWRQYRASAAGTSFREQDFPINLFAGKKPNARFVAKTVLTYVQLHDGIAVWLTNANGTTAKWIEIRAADLESQVTRFVEECSDPNSNLTTLQRDGYKLYSLLIEPIAGQLKENELLVVETDGVIGRVPLQALPDRYGRFLGLEHPIVITPGSIRSSWIPLRMSTNNHVLIVGAPTLTPGLTPAFPPLSNALYEAEFVDSFFRNKKLLTREAATPAAVLQGLKNANLFHFAGHALSTTTGGRLLLAGPEPGGFLDAKELSRLVPRSRGLAILSSCPTEAVDDRTSNPDGLIRAFGTAGFAEVLAARWNVDSTATQSFMQRLYPAMLERGQSVATALREAARITRNQPLTSHPFYWAAFTVYVNR